MNPFTAAIWQTTSLPYDKEANLARALRAMEAAHARGASLLVLPEMFLTGYLIRDRLEELAEPVPDGPSLLVLREKARALSLALDGAKLICMGAANMTPYEDYHFVYMHTRAMENRIYTLYCNYVGTEKRFHYCGQSGAFHPTGKILAQADPRSEALLLADIDLADTTAQDDFLNYLRHRQTQVYHPDLLG